MHSKQANTRQQRRDAKKIGTTPLDRAPHNLARLARISKGFPRLSRSWMRQAARSLHGNPGGN
jgi:hypothetical protein